LLGQRESLINGNPDEAGAGFDGLSVSRPAILLHSCCGPCSTAVVERLAPRFRITIYFYNPNLDDEAEYLRRLEAQKEFVDRYNASVHENEPVSLVCAAHTPQSFLKLVEGFESCAEGGERCRLCIGDRLEKTAAFAAMNGFEYFSTTLSVSRYKSYEMILESGKAMALKYRLSFVDDNFRKGGGDGRADLLAKSYGLYRQNFCGCGFSKK